MPFKFVEEPQPQVVDQPRFRFVDEPVEAGPTLGQRAGGLGLSLAQTAVTLPETVINTIRWGQEVEGNSDTLFARGMDIYSDKFAETQDILQGWKPPIIQEEEGQRLLFDESGEFDPQMPNLTQLTNIPAQSLSYLLPGTAVMKALKPLAAFGKTIPVTAGMAPTMATQIAGQEFSETERAAYDAAIAQGFDPELAKTKAAEAGMEAAKITFGTSLATSAAGLGAASRIGGPLPARIVAGSLVDAPFEAAEEGGQNLARQTAMLPITGELVDLKETANAAALGAVAQAPHGGVTAALQTRPQANVPLEPDVAPAADTELTGGTPDAEAFVVTELVQEQLGVSPEEFAASPDIVQSQLVDKAFAEKKVVAPEQEIETAPETQPERRSAKQILSMKDEDLPMMLRRQEDIGMSEAQKPTKTEPISQTREVRERINAEQDSLITAITKLGGISPEAAREANLEGKALRPENEQYRGIKHFVHKKGVDWDTMKTRLQEEGYVSEDEQDYNSLLSRVDEELSGGQKQYSTQFSEKGIEQQAEEQFGIDTQVDKLLSTPGLENVKVTVKAVVQETGKTVTYTENADVALRDVRERKNFAEDLKLCLSL